MNTTDKKGTDNRIVNLLKSDAFGGILLILFTAIALIWANSPFKDSYHHLWETHMAIEVSSFHLELHLLHFINDVLMAIFFFLIGLEIKREIIAGELSSMKKASLPAMGAIGGMLIPALIYILFVINSGNELAQSGWGIPMATDIAFSLGIISLLGKRVPIALKIFLVALAIVDDLGAILVIALFYTEQIHLSALFIGLGIIVLLFVLNKLKVRNISIYLILGAVVWYFFHESGIHATIAGVLVALTIPIRREIDVNVFRNSLNKIQIPDDRHTEHTLTHHQIEHLEFIKNQIKKLESPVQRLEHSLHRSVNYLIMPLFALANAGVTLGEGGGKPISIVTYGIIAGLFIGKSVGITFVSWLGCKLGIAELPTGINFKKLFSVAILGGLGFTMSLFIANLAFTGEAATAILSQAKVGILIGSLLSGIVGYLVLKKLFANKEG